MPPVDRVLPWRRQHRAQSDELAAVLSAYRGRRPKAPTALIERAYSRAASAHGPQRRSSGEAYINHPLAVAKIVAEFGLDEIALAAALLHDAVEDTEMTVDDVEREFGSAVAVIVNGVTKLERMHFDSKEAQQAESMRKLIVSTAKDPRVLFIKLADRLHNMRTLAAMNPDKQSRIAEETLSVYAPLAHRLGMQQLRQQLEDLAFASLFPKRFAALDHLVSTRTPEQDVYIAKVVAETKRLMSDISVDGEVAGRGKHLWSIYEKMIHSNREFGEIFDIVAIRILVDSVKDCYAALGCIHGKWIPVQGRFKDYIAMPKFNLYQSLHTTVMGPEGKPVEVQIRTHEMHRQAEWGVASHWVYKDGASQREIAWVNRIVDWQSEVSDPNQFMETLKSDLDTEEVFVFTPKGMVHPLPVGATPIDFAYAVHTAVGHSCIGARVNGQLVALNSTLNSGDTCEIIRSKVESSGPSRDWLQFAVSPRARNKIRQWFSRERREDSLDTGREELLNELRREGLPAQKIMNSDTLSTEAEVAGYGDAVSFLVAIGEHHVSARAIAQRIARSLRSSDSEEQLAVEVLNRRPRRRSRRNVGVRVDGLEDVLIRLSKCCTPVPGDEILGFITRGRGVSVHRLDCANVSILAKSAETPMVDVEWEGSAAETSVYRANVEVVAFDRARLLGDVAHALSEHRVNIVACHTGTGSDRMAKLRFEFEMVNPGHLDAVLSSIKKIDSVYDAYRVVPGRGA
jgi:GTP diphosphokinase / guanosine-3',5'-bis(diphosphate) 3'-diphosphatase